jgi:uncharacterized cupin superfamily protein
MPDPLRSSAPHLTDPAAFNGPLVDWGEIPTMIEGQSRTSGLLLHRNADGSSECGIWECTPGYWNCHGALPFPVGALHLYARVR